jgi:hypothetical protein
LIFKFQHSVPRYLLMSNFVTCEVSFTKGYIH